VLSQLCCAEQHTIDTKAAAVAAAKAAAAVCRVSQSVTISKYSSCREQQQKVVLAIQLAPSHNEGLGVSILRQTGTNRQHSHRPYTKGILSG